LFDINRCSGAVIDAALKVHTLLGPGLLESAYEVCLRYELQKRGHRVDRQRTVPIVYADVSLDIGFRIDLLVDNWVVVEVKAVSKLVPVHEAQLLSYLKLSGHHLGLLINFNVVHLRDGIRRLVNNLIEPSRAERPK